MKRMIMSVLSVLTYMLVCISGLQVSAAESIVSLYDEADMYSYDQEKSIKTILSAASDEIGFSIGLYIGGIDRTDRQIEELCKKNAFELMRQSGNSGSVFCYIDFDGKKNAYDYIFAANDASLYYTYGLDDTEDRIDLILQRMEAFFPTGGQEADPESVFEGIEEYGKQLKHYKEKGMDKNAYYIDPDTKEYVYASNGQVVRSQMRPYRKWIWGLLLGIAIGCIVAVIISINVKNRYKFKSSTSASVYTTRKKLHMREQSDVFLGTNVTKVRIQSSSGSHGGGGHIGGGHVGGGGGGRHR